MELRVARRGADQDMGRRAGDGCRAVRRHGRRAACRPEGAAIVPGKTLWVDLHLDIAPGWHTYWRNPGDSGLPTEISWKLPSGFSAGEIAWPVPQRFVENAIGNYGYSGS